MMDKHTPGPWESVGFGSDWRAPCREDSQASSVRRIASTAGECVAMAVVSYEEWSNPSRDAELRAKARLIAAAPELLDALTAIATLYDTDAGCRSMPEYQAACSAIAKATGTPWPDA